VDYKDLRAYQLARELGREVWMAVVEWPSFERWSIGMQLVRSADSIAANIAEARGRWHRPDQQRLLFIARGSLYEAGNWIELAQERGLLDPQVGTNVVELARTLNGLIHSTRQS
jgi:four helix bundle protein